MLSCQAVDFPQMKRRNGFRVSEDLRQGEQGRWCSSVVTDTLRLSCLRPQMFLVQHFWWKHPNILLGGTHLTSQNGETSRARRRNDFIRHGSQYKNSSCHLVLVGLNLCLPTLFCSLTTLQIWAPNCVQHLRWLYAWVDEQEEMQWALIPIPSQPHFLDLCCGSINSQ